MQTTIQAIISQRVETGLADLLLSVYDAGYCAGASVPIEAPAHAGLSDLLALIAARHKDEVLALRGWLDAPLTSDDLPGWLLRLPQQSDVQYHAAAERAAALGDSVPPPELRGVA